MEFAPTLSSLVLRGWLGDDGNELRVRITLVSADGSSVGHVVSTGAEVHEAVDSWILAVRRGG